MADCVMNIGSKSPEQLRSIIERVERLEEEKKGIAEDIRDVYAEANGNGYDVKALREIVRLRRQDAQKRADHEAIVNSYKNALGVPILASAGRRIDSCLSG